MRFSSIPNIALSFISICSTISALPLPAPDSSASAGNSTSGAVPKRYPTKSVLSSDFPDPSIMQDKDGIYYAFATSAHNVNIQVARSGSFSPPNWVELNIDVLPDAGAWTKKNDHNIWAPYVARNGQGKYVMYYSAVPSADSSKHCVGWAVSDTITGVYKPSNAPFVCDLGAGGSIDPSIFRDPSGKTYVVYKVDGNSLGRNAPTPIMLQQVNPQDLTTPIGGPVQIFDQDPTPRPSTQAKAASKDATANADAASLDDGFLVEAPTLIYNKETQTYYLLFSTNDYASDKYDIRYVSSKTLAGEFDSTTQAFLMRTGDGNGVVGPGSADVTSDGKIVFHGRTNVGPLVREMYAGRVAVQNGKLVYTGGV